LYIFSVGLNEGETAPSFTPLKRGRYSSKFRKHTAIRLSYDPSQIQAETKEDIEDAIAEGDLLQVKVRSASTTTPQQVCTSINIKYHGL